MGKLRQLVAGNWKMNGTAASLAEIDAVKAGIAGTSAEVAICPPATLIARAAERAAGSALLIGGQDCHAKANGAHTGDIAAEMIADAGGNVVDVAHQRAFSGRSVREVVVDFTLETRHERHAREIADALRTAGYAVLDRGALDQI